MQVERRTLQGDLAVAHAAQPRGDARRIDVPHIGVADQREIGRERLLVGSEERFEVGAADLLLALQQHGHRGGNAAADLLPGAQRLDEHHQLSLVVDGAARNDARRHADLRQSADRTAGCPKLERIRRLHIVVPVEQDTRRLRAGGAGMMPEHDRMPGSRLDRDLESKTCKLVTEPLGRLLHIRLMHGLRADAGNAQQLEQAFARLIQILIHPREHSIDRAVRIGDHGAPRSRPRI